MPRRILDIFRRKPLEKPSIDLQPSAFSTHEDLSQPANKKNQGEEDNQHTDSYFAEITAMQQAISARDYEQARRHALAALDHVPGFIDELLLQESPNIAQSIPPAIPPMEKGGLMFALLDDRAGIEQIKKVAASRDQLAKYQDIHIKHEKSLALFRAIEQAVATQPGIHQKNLKHAVGTTDGRRVSTLVAWLEKAGRIRREPSGRTYSLFPMTEAEALRAKTNSLPQKVGSHRRGNSPTIKAVDWSMINFIPLPRSPSKWQLEPRDSREGIFSEAFVIVDSQAWTIKEIEKLALEERPDPAFRRLYATGCGVLALDDLGKSVQNAKAAAIRYGREGEIEAREPLAHGIYRIGVSAISGIIVALSRKHIAHAYDEKLRLIFETDLSLAPEIIAIQRRLDIDATQLHTRIRSVAISDDAQRYLFTAVDEAWCVNTNGTGVWGIKVPLQAGFEIQSDEAIGTQAEIQEALDIMGLALPLAASDVKQRYRALAKEWHPDVNPSPNAGAHMKEINHAVTLLTGLEGEALAGQSGTRRYYKEMDSNVLRKQNYDVNVSVGIVASEETAADWIYASSFAAGHTRAFVATYSGKVLEIDSKGRPVRYYGIGNVPRRIIDTGEYLYLLTDTRLYMLQNDLLIAIIDISQGGEIIVTQTGFGLLERKRFRWFNERGIHVATVLSKNPLRRVYQKSNELVIETRTQRLNVGGPRPWWR